MVRVFHCDDSAAYRALIRAELEDDAEIEVVGGASSVSRALGELAAARADVVLLDLLDTSGDVVVLSGHPREYGEPRRAGAYAYVEKSAPMSELRDTVLRAAGG
jgi:hypothetical protein